MATTGLRQLTERERAIIGKYAAKHGAVHGLEAPIADTTGGIGLPLIRLSTLAQLERRGTITTEQAAAGDRFHALFQRGGLDGLKAADPARVPAAGGLMFGDQIPPAGERCRVRVGEAVAALGGNGSVAASIVWHVIGLEWSVRKWALSTQRREEQAAGILIASLAMLASHFAGRRQRRS